MVASNPAIARLSDWSAVPGDPEASRLLLNRRIAYCGRVFFLVSLAFYLRNVGLIALLERRWPPFGHPSLLLHVAAMLVVLAQWLACRSGARTLAQLNVIDPAGLVGSLLLYGGLTISEAAGFEHAVAVESGGAEVLLVALIMLSFVVTRAIIVPTSAQRTFWISTCACAVGMASAYGVAYVGFPAAALERRPWLPLNQALYVGMWALFTVAMATIAARVIHGLQQRVREANEVGQYRLQEKIGEGGMGVVYLAHHALLRRPTAVKLLPVERSSEQAIRRFEQEVRLTSALTHPNTIAIFDFGRTPDGVFYYAMEYLDGVTLEDLVAHAGPQPAARVVHLLKQVCGALTEAHALGLVHRDIKPANLMVCTRGLVPDQIKVLDFGLVKEQTSTATGLSVAGALLGTPSYLPPEAILVPERVDARSDLYAVGAVGYFLLAGRPVFEGATLVEICAKHLHSEPPPLAAGDVLVPAQLERLILGSLAKDPAARPASAATMLAALDAIDVAWSLADAEGWWSLHGSAVRAAARARHRASSTPGPLTVAIDLQRRDAASAATLAANAATKP